MVPSIERVALNMQTLSQQKEKDRKSRLILKLESIEGYFEIANHNETHCCQNNVKRMVNWGLSLKRQRTMYLTKTIYY